MKRNRWTNCALFLTCLLLAAPIACADDEPDSTTIIREDDDDPDVEVQVDEEDDGFQMDVEVDEEGGVSGNVEIEEDNP